MWQYNTNYLSHHGILGQKWGIRRFQNPDGSLTPAGKKRYGTLSTDDIQSAKALQRRLNDVDKAIARNKKSYEKNLGDSFISDRESQYFNEKAQKYREKIKTENDKYHNKYKKYTNKSTYKGLLTHIEAQMAAENKNNIDKGNKEIDQLLKIAKDMGYVVNKKEIYRNVNSNKKQVIATLLRAVLGIGGSITGSIVGGPITGGTVGGAIGGGLAGAFTDHEKGIQYKVKRK